jgi:hypothetical protein
MNPTGATQILDVSGAILGMALSDRGTLEGLTQFRFAIIEPA